MPTKYLTFPASHLYLPGNFSEEKVNSEVMEEMLSCIHRWGIVSPLVSHTIPTADFEVIPILIILQY